MSQIKYTVGGKILRLRAPPRKLPPEGEAGRKKTGNILGNTSCRDYYTPYQPESAITRKDFLKMLIEQRQVQKDRFRKGVDIARKKFKAHSERQKSVIFNYVAFRSRVL